MRCNDLMHFIQAGEGERGQLGREVAAARNEAEEARGRGGRAEEALAAARLRAQQLEAQLGEAGRGAAERGTEKGSAEREEAEALRGQLQLERMAREHAERKVRPQLLL
jgi:hypothetical protein